MEVDNLVVTTPKELIDSIAQLIVFIYESRHILVHMVDNTRDEWTSGYNCTRMNEGRINTFGPLMCEKDVSSFHIEVQEINHHELNMLLKKIDYLIQKWRVVLKEKIGSKSGWGVFFCV
jgi:hypothetical protein